jgi:hypothetical protein
MAQPVWALSVDLQTRTATFTSGLGDAARSARGSFQDIRDSASEMSSATSGSMAEARHGVMLLGEEFGVHLPRGITMFISSLGPVAAAMEAAFPFIAILVGATLLVEHLAKIKEAGDRTATEWGHIETEATKALSKTGDALLEVEMQADRLSGNGLAALHKQLTLIDHQSMSELESTFDGLASKIDAVLKAGSRGTLMSTLIGAGASEKVKAEFDAFKDQYDSLLSQHKDSEARGALVDEIIRAQEQLKKYQSMPQTSSWVREAVGDYGQLITQLENVNRLQDEYSEIASKKKGNVETEHMEDLHPELFVDAENKKRVSLAETLAAIKKTQEAANAADKLQLEGMESLAKGLKEISDERAKLAQEAGKEDAGHGLRMAQLQLEADREAGKMQILQRAMTDQEILKMELEFNAKEHAAQQVALNAEMAALDTQDKAYENKKKALNDKLLELDQQFRNKQQQLEDQAQTKQMSTLTTWLQKQQDLYAGEFSKVLMGKESFGKMMQNVDSQIASQALSQALSSIVALETVQGRKKFNDARVAAADAWADAGNPILGAVMAAGTFAAVMGLERGGIVPGISNFDSVPAMLTPGEAVLPKGFTEVLTNAARFGNTGTEGGGDTHIHHSHNHFHISAIDGASIKGMLDKHGDQFVKHAESHLRKMNR